MGVIVVVVASGCHLRVVVIFMSPVDVIARNGAPKTVWESVATSFVTTIPVRGGTPYPVDVRWWLWNFLVWMSWVMLFSSCSRCRGQSHRVR